MAINIALAGNPNCGKTTMFNDLTGANQYVGNWPGVTVEKKEGRYRADKGVVVTDLPGVYSLSPYTPEEIVTRDYLMSGKPDAVINLVDATNLERNLYLTTQIIDLGIPTVVALNMMDLVEKNGDKIDVDALAKRLGCPVVPTSALRGRGMEEVVKAAIEAGEKGAAPATTLRFTNEVEEALARVIDVAGAVPSGPPCSLVRHQTPGRRAAHHRRAEPAGRRALEDRRHPRASGRCGRTTTPSPSSPTSVTTISRRFCDACVKKSRRP